MKIPSISRFTSLKEQHGAARDALVYAFSSSLGRAIGFLLIPIYTRELDPAQFGMLSIGLSAFGVLSIMLSLGLDASLFRSLFQFEEDSLGRERFVQSIWRFISVFGLIAALLLAVVASAIPSLGGLDQTSVLLVLFAAASYGAASTVPATVLRARQQPNRFLLVSLTSSLGQAALVFLLVVILHLGVHGWLLGMGIGQALTVVVACLTVPLRRMDRFDKVGVRGAISYALPMLPHSLAQWSLALADRLILAGLVSASALGVYSLGSNLGLPVMVGVQAINFALMPRYAKAGFDSAAQSTLSRLMALQGAAVMVITTGGVLIGPPLVAIMAPSNYSGAASVVPWIALGYGFLGLYYLPMNLVTLVEGRNRFAWIATVASAAVNIGLLYLVVPTGGIEAAAAATAVGYLVLLLGIYKYSRRTERGRLVKWPAKSLSASAAVCGFGVVLAFTALPGDGYSGLGARTMVFMSTAVSVLLLNRSRP